MVRGFVLPRQANEFYYLCGVETPHSYLLLDGRTRKATLFLSPRNARLERSEGRVLSAADVDLAKSLTGVDEVLSTEALRGEGLAALPGGVPPVLYTPFQPAEGWAESRYEIQQAGGAIASDPFDGRVPREGQLVALLRARHPRSDVRDLTPTLDAMRVVKSPREMIPFHPYYTAKDLFGLSAFLIVYAVFVFFAPNVLGDPINYVEANPLSTPPHIVPEWYFLPFYAILRAIPSKLFGVAALIGSIAILFFVPWLDTSRVRSTSYRPIYKWFFWAFVLTCIALGYLGSQPPEGIYLVFGRILTAYYFLFFLVVMPVVGWIEKPKALPGSITESVLGPQETPVAAAKPAPHRRAPEPVA
jgi:hypothetical protein